MDPEIAAIYRESKAVSMNQGASYLLLKASSKRRRTKEEIKQQDEEERQERLEVEAKMARYDQMERQQQQQEGLIEGAKNLFDQKEGLLQMLQVLKQKGMVKFDENTDTFSPVDNIEEMQQLSAQNEQESAAAEKMREQNEQLAKNGMHQDRRRAGNYLEAITDFNNNQ